MINAGVDLYAVGKVLGHADHKPTMRYSRLANEALLAAVEAGAAKLQGVRASWTFRDRNISDSKTITTPSGSSARASATFWSPSGACKLGVSDVNLIIILIVGAVVGWLAGMIMRSGGGLIFDIIIGIVGALIAGFVFGGGASILNSPLNIASILYSLLGAIVLLAVIKLIRRRSV